MKTNALNKNPITPGTCEWCGKDCELEDVACCLTCEAQLHRLEAVQGRIVLRTLKKWRKFSGRKGTPGEGAFSEVTALVDGFMRTDRLRRERYGEQRRREAAAAAAEPAAKPAKPATVRSESASPAINEPEPNNDEWLAGMEKRNG